MGFSNGGEARQRRQIDTPDYRGEDRRHGGGQRSTDKIASNIKLIAVALGIAMTVFTMGGAWVGSKLALDGKVDKSDFATKNAEQDTKIREALYRVQSAEALIRDNVIPDLGDIKRRARDIYCDGKPPGCQ